MLLFSMLIDFNCQAEPSIFKDIYRNCTLLLLLMLLFVLFLGLVFSFFVISALFCTFAEMMKNCIIYKTVLFEIRENFHFRVAQLSEINLMSKENLMLLFGPIFLNKVCSFKFV